MSRSTARRRTSGFAVVSIATARTNLPNRPQSSSRKENHGERPTAQTQHLGRWAAGLGLLIATSLFIAACGDSNNSSTTRAAESSRILACGSAPGPRPTVVLVHGAWADTSSWAGEVQALRRAGYTARAIADPLTDVITDARRVADVVRAIGGPVVLVGHSYGGSVITNAAAGQSTVKALVYVDAAIPAPNEATKQLSGTGSVLDTLPASRLYQSVGSGNATELYLQPDVFRADFASDFPRGQASDLWAIQRSASPNAFASRSHAAAWRTIPSWAFVSTGDRIITPASKMAMARSAHAHMTLFHGGSHLTLISHPRAVTAVIAKAICSVRHPASALG